ncbi:MAG: ankyrin repeat domain-containing protein [Clostridia bacterium]|nr:ankyrin repeat domain-containing protein [Clostridia bacterium]
MQRQELLNQFYSKALSNGCNELAEELIGLGANYHKRESEETVALMEAAKSGYLEKVKRLSKDDVNLVDEHNKTALMHASENGYLTIVSYLLEKKADVLIRSEWGEHALKLAAAKGHIKVVKKLLKEIATNYSGVMWPLNDALEAAIEGKCEAISKEIAENLKSVSIESLEAAVENNNIEMAKKLIPKVRNLDCPVGFNGHYTLLGIAAQNGFLEMSKILLDEGASVDMQHQYGATPLFLAAENGHLEVVNMLLDEYNANPNLYDGGSIIRYTPLMKAAQNNHYEVVRALANKNADLNAFSTGVRKTALMWAIDKGAEESVRELVDCGANLNLKQLDGYELTALDLAPEESNIKKILRDAGAKTTWQLLYC